VSFLIVAAGCIQQVASMQRSGVRPSVCSMTAENHAQKIVCRAWLMSRGSSGRSEMTQGKTRRC